jgi:hypothetical protein
MKDCYAIMKESIYTPIFGFARQKIDCVCIDKKTALKIKKQKNEKATKYFYFVKKVKLL